MPKLMRLQLHEILIAQIERYPDLGTSIDSVLKLIGEEPIVDFARRFIMEIKEWKYSILENIKAGGSRSFESGTSIL